VSGSLPAIVLAAGASSRMGRPKALLPLGSEGRTFAFHVTATLAAAGLTPVLVVTREALRAPLEQLRLPSSTVIVNEAPERGQMSSLLTGLDVLGEVDAVMMTLVDLPLVREGTVRALIDAWRTTGGALVRPAFHGRHGHPAIFGSEVLAALRSADLASGAKPVLERFAEGSVSLAVDDPGVVDDVDTPEAYRRLLG
jgi:molybdenum cofactor cytidylyltransferase